MGNWRKALIVAAVELLCLLGHVPARPATAATKLTEQEIDDTIQMLRDQRSTVIIEEQRCLQAYLRNPSQTEMAAGRRRVAGAERRAIGAVDDLQEARGFVDTLSSAVVAKQAIGELEGAQGAAEDMEDRRRGAHVGSQCANVNAARRRALDKLIHQAISDRPGFVAFVEQQEEIYRGRIKQDSRALLAHAEEVLPKLLVAKKYEEISDEAARFLQNAEAFEDRYDLEIKRKRFQETIEPSVEAATVLRNLLTSWRNEDERAGREAVAKGEVEKARKWYAERPSEVRKINLQAAQHNLAQTVRERDGFRQERSRYLADVRRSLDAAWAVVKVDSSSPVSP